MSIDNGAAAGAQFGSPSDSRTDETVSGGVCGKYHPEQCSSLLCAGMCGRCNDIQSSTGGCSIVSLFVESSRVFKVQCSQVMFDYRSRRRKLLSD